MAEWCLKANGKIVPRRYVVPLTTAQLNNSEEILKRNVFTKCIRKRYGDSINLTPFLIKMEDLDFVPYEDDGEKNIPRLIPETEAVDYTNLPVLQKPFTDRLLNNKVYIPQGDSMQVSKVSRRIIDEYGKIVGTYSDNPMLYTLMYDVELPDGATKPYAANMIVSIIHKFVDLYGHRLKTFRDILN